MSVVVRVDGTVIRAVLALGVLRAAGGGEWDARAYLIRITTWLALNRLRQQKVRREWYVGPWLPSRWGAGEQRPVPGSGDSQ